MKAILILSMLSVCLSAKAQFHTVARRQPVCRIDTKKGLPPVEKVSNPNKESVSTAGKFPANEYGEWVRRYMSVSYPLKRITVTSPYGLRIDPFSKKRSRHNGIDLRAKGEEAYAMLSGVVVKVGYDRRSGNFVTLRHGGYTVSYCHLSQVLVRRGASVMPGEVIAITGNTGRSTGPPYAPYLQIPKPLHQSRYSLAVCPGDKRGSCRPFRYFLTAFFLRIFSVII